MAVILQCSGTETRSRGMIASHATRERPPQTREWCGPGTSDAPRRTRDRRHSAGHLLHAQTLQDTTPCSGLLANHQLIRNCVDHDGTHNRPGTIQMCTESDPMNFLGILPLVSNTQVKNLIQKNSKYVDPWFQVGRFVRGGGGKRLICFGKYYFPNLFCGGQC